jgi:hypothetical protein
MKLGKPKRVYRVEPIRDPVPRQVPEKGEPARDPARVPAGPARSA